MRGVVYMRWRVWIVTTIAWKIKIKMGSVISMKCRDVKISRLAIIFPLQQIRVLVILQILDGIALVIVFQIQMVMGCAML